MGYSENSFLSTNAIFVLDQHTSEILDVNEPAVSIYGYSREEFLSMNVNDLGTKIKRTKLGNITSESKKSADKVWIHKTKSGEIRYVQFTSHVFMYNGGPAKLAVAHDVSDLVNTQEFDRYKFPKPITHQTNTPLAEVKWDNNMRVIEWSEKAEDLFGWSEDEVLGREDFFKELIPPEDMEAAFLNINQAVANVSNHYSTEGKARTKEGNVIVCEWYNSVLFNKEKELVSIHSLITDISRRKQSENLFRALSEESLVGVYLIQDGVFKYVNPRLCQIFGYSKEEIELNLGPLDLTHPEDKAVVDKNLRDRLEGNVKSMKYDFRCVTKDGHTIHVNVFGSKITYMGKPAVIGTLVDITDSKLAYERYRASVESFEDLFDSISDALYIQDQEGKFIEVNESAVALNGYNREFLIGNTPDVLAAPGKVDLEETWDYFYKALHGEPQHFEQWGIRKNGEVFPEEVILNPGSYFGEDVVIAISRDISQRYEAEEQVRKNEEMFRQLFQNAPIGIVLMDNRQDIRMVNKAFTEIFGYESEEIEGLDIDKLIVPEDELDVAEAASGRIFEGKTINVWGKRKRKDGGLVDVLIYGVPVTIEEGRTIAIFGIYVDISDRRDAEEKVKKSLKEKEVLLAEIHHRVKNNLAVITGLLELQGYNTTQEEAKEVLKESQMRVNSIALIHEKLYQNENLSEISFEIYMQELTEVISSSLQSANTDVEISFDVDPVHLTVNQAIPCGLILNELITNAFKHAFPRRKSGNIGIKFKAQNDKKVQLTVCDDGIGLPEKLTLDNPKTLGLTLIRTLSRQLNGEAEFVNHSDGAKFILVFELET